MGKMPGRIMQTRESGHNENFHPILCNDADMGDLEMERNMNPDSQEANWMCLCLGLNDELNDIERVGRVEMGIEVDID